MSNREQNKKCRKNVNNIINNILIHIYSTIPHGNGPVNLRNCCSLKMANNDIEMA